MKISKNDLDMLHYWESVDMRGKMHLVVKYVQFMDYLYDKYDIEIYKHRIDRKTGEIGPLIMPGQQKK